VLKLKLIRNKNMKFNLLLVTLLEYKE